MENQDYRDDYVDYGPEGSQGGDKSVLGLKIAIIILLVVLAVVTVLFWNSVRVSDEDQAAMKIELDTLNNQYSRLVVGMDGLKFDNDTLNRNLQSERFKADSLMQKLKRERQISYSKIKQYERELGTLRSAMQGFVRQIDSLNRLNQKLVGENLKYKKEISVLSNRAAAAEETAAEQNSKIKRASVIRARDITLRPLNKREKEVTRARQAEKLVASLVLTTNELSTPGVRTVFVRIISPDGYCLSENQGAMFDFEGQRIPYTASREVDYQGEDLAVSVYYSGTNLTSGKYTVLVYMDGYLLGSNDIILK